MKEGETERTSEGVTLFAPPSLFLLFVTFVFFVVKLLASYNSAAPSSGFPFDLTLSRLRRHNARVRQPL